LKPGQKVGVMVGSLASVVLGKRGLSTVPYAFEPDMVEDVAAGALYACASSPATIAYYSHTHAGAPLNLVHAYDREPELSWTVSVGMRKADEALVAAINQALDALLEDGTITAIYARYGVEHRRP
jgi:ABC-type amino acid transport substrate-binding protein